MTVIVSILFLFSMVMAQAIKTPIGEILNNPDKYDGKMVQVQGKVESIKVESIKREGSIRVTGGRPYTTFSIRDSSNGSLNVYSFGNLPINNADSVSVTGVYHIGSSMFHNGIDATDGSVDKL
jgi:hypothetical protein